MNALHVRVYGQVQSVGFRNWIKNNADSKKLTGWVRNASDGSVEIFLQGNEELVNQLLALCWEGPDIAEVDDVLTQDTNYDESILSFEIH